MDLNLPPGVSYDALVAASGGRTPGGATLYALEVGKKAGVRDVLFAETTAFGPIPYFKNKATDSRGIPLNFSKYDDHSIMIQPRSPLIPGEYAFVAVVTPDRYVPQNQSYYYCFGVD